MTRRAIHFAMVAAAGAVFALVSASAAGAATPAAPMSAAGTQVRAAEQPGATRTRHPDPVLHRGTSAMAQESIRFRSPLLRQGEPTAAKRP